MLQRNNMLTWIMLKKKTRKNIIQIGHKIFIIHREY